MACAPLMPEEDLARFRTKLCKRLLVGHCEFRRRCQYSHDRYWPRRCPFYLVAKQPRRDLRYLPMICPDVNIAENPEVGCKRGGGCPFAHSTEEIAYHPLLYKTRSCPKYHRGECSEYYCSLIHGFAEARKPGAFYLPFRLSNHSSCDSDAAESSQHSPTDKEEGFRTPLPYVPKIPGVLNALSSHKIASSETEDTIELLKGDVAVSAVDFDVTSSWCLSLRAGGAIKILHIVPGDESSVKTMSWVYGECVAGLNKGTIGWVPMCVLFVSTSPSREWHSRAWEILSGIEDGKILQPKAALEEVPTKSMLDQLSFTELTTDESVRYSPLGCPSSASLSSFHSLLLKDDDDFFPGGSILDECLEGMTRVAWELETGSDTAIWDAEALGKVSKVCQRILGVVEREKMTRYHLPLANRTKSIGVDRGSETTTATANANLEDAEDNFVLDMVAEAASKWHESHNDESPLISPEHVFAWKNKFMPFFPPARTGMSERALRSTF
eukprot:GHVO01067451.1.p1 GENE.GHVO01067451.1~~GHVO01067451.1.p1  ORF type:complete len:497 (+),score=42.91 GHVO01067451.1:555-2045(+)